MSAQDYERAPMALATGAAHSVKLPPRVMRGRLTGFLFDSGRTFLLPKALAGIKALKGFYDAHPGLKVLVTGHTDTVGPPHYNRGLSEERAASVAAYLVDDVDTWLTRYQGSPWGTRWDVHEDQHMLTALPDGAPPYYSGPISGALDTVTRDALRHFQADHGLPTDGMPGPQTRRALVADYMAIDGTSLPPGTEVQQHGCGERHHAVPTPDETDEPRNRRVEVFYFEGPVAPPPTKPCAAAGCAEYPVWLANTVLTIDHDLGEPLHSATVEVVDPTDQPVGDAEVVLQGMVAQRGTSGPDGLAYFHDLPAGRYPVVAHHAHYRSGESELLVGQPAVVLAAAPVGTPATNKAKVPLQPRLLHITYRQMFSVDNKKEVRLRGIAVEAGITVTIDGTLTATTNANGVATFDAAVVGPGIHRAVASARSVDKQYVGATGPLVLPRPAPKDDVLYRDMDIQFVMSPKLEVAGKGDAPELFSLHTDGGVWREGPLDILVDWKPVWIRAVKHSPRAADVRPQHLVVHRTAGASMQSAGGLIVGDRDTSVHYVVDVDGYVLKLVREDEISNHAGSSFWNGRVGLNPTSVGIEIVSADNQDYPPRQMAALRDLMWRIEQACPIPLHHVVGHSDIDVINTNPSKPIDLTPGTERPHDPGIELDWFMLGQTHALLGALGTAVALAADPTTVTQAERDAMYGGYFKTFSEPWQNGDTDKGLRWGGKARKATDVTTADPIAELQRDFKKIGYSIASTTAQQPSGVFGGGLGRLCVRFKHRWFGGPANKPRWSTFKDKPTLDRETAVMIKAVLKSIP